MQVWRREVSRVEWLDSRNDNLDPQHPVLASHPSPVVGSRRLAPRPQVDVTPVQRNPGVRVNPTTPTPPQSVNQRDAAPRRFQEV